MTEVVTAEELVSALKQVRQLLEKGWCKGVFARDADGMSVSPRVSSGCQWCLAGAVHRVCGTSEDGLYGCLLFDRVVTALSDTLNASHEGSIKTLPDFNDEQESVEPVLELIDKTIERLEKRVAP